MEVLALTILVSLMLAALFLVGFVWAVRRPEGGSLEQDSLLPLREDKILPAPKATEKS